MSLFYFFKLVKIDSIVIYLNKIKVLTIKLKHNLSPITLYMLYHCPLCVGVCACLCTCGTAWRELWPLKQYFGLRIKNTDLGKKVNRFRLKLMIIEYDAKTKYKKKKT